MLLEFLVGIVGGAAEFTSLVNVNHCLLISGKNQIIHGFLTGKRKWRSLEFHLLSSLPGRQFLLQAALDVGEQS